MDYRKTSSIIAVVLCILFCFFVLLHERYAYNAAQSNIEKHARVISDALWNYNAKGASEYLKLACNSQNYKQLVVTDTDGKIFQKIVNKDLDKHNNLFMFLHLIPSVRLTTDVVYNKKTIGRINALWNCDTIYLQVYVLFALILLYVIFHLNIRLIYSKHVLEDRISERTKELADSNISLQHEIEKQRQAEEALRQSEDRYRTLVENIDLGITLIDSDHNIIMTNTAQGKLFKKDINTFIGKKCFREFEKRETVCRYCPGVETMATGQPAHAETEAIRNDGSRFNVRLHTFPTFSNDGASTGFIKIMEDITEKKKLEAQLLHAQKMESIGTLAGGIAHDFNNILFPIMGFAELALEDLPKESLIRNNIQEIFQGAKRASNLVKQILTFSRQSTQKPKPLKVQLIVEEVLKLMRSSLPATIEIKQDISSECGLVMADEGQTHQVVMNLVTNAFQAMEDDGGVLQVVLKEVELTAADLTGRSLAPDTYVSLIVADTGPGMDQAVITRTFEPYFTTKENGKGTGLGLAVAHGIVKSFQGDIIVHSEPGKGTEFIVYLPKIKSLAEPEKADAAAPVPKGTERILFVDDEDQIVRMGKQMLERLGYDVTPTTGSIEALEVFRAAPETFDLVITDMTMPKMTGVQLSQKLLEIRTDIPIIICTGFSTKIDPEKAKAAGIRDYAMKPLVKSEIAKKIRDVLDQN